MIPEREPGPREPRPFTSGFAILLPFVAWYLQVAVSLLMLALMGSDQPSSLSPALLGISSILAYGGALALAAPRIPPPPAQALGFVPAPRISWVAALTLLPSILLISELDNVFKAIWPPPEAVQNLTEEPPAGLHMTELAVVLIAVLPVVEEIFFRGLLQPRVIELWGRRRGILATAALAAVTTLLSSGNLWVLPTALGSGLVLGILRESSGSVLPGLMLNVLFGTTTLLALSGAFGIPGFDDLSAPHTPLHWLAAAAVATGLGIRLCRTTWLARRKLEKSEPPGELF
jgi:membrane protease YdiL (CAAX protease family)